MIIHLFITLVVLAIPIYLLYIVFSDDTIDLGLKCIFTILLAAIIVGIVTASVEIYRMNHPINSYKCVVISKYVPEYPLVVAVQNPEFGVSYSKVSWEKWAKIEDGDTIICKGWNEKYLTSE